MIYHLSDRLKGTLESIGIKNSGYIFTKLIIKMNHIVQSTIRNHWNNKPIVIHQIRNCIATYLKMEWE